MSSMTVGVCGVNATLTSGQPVEELVDESPPLPLPLPLPTISISPLLLPPCPAEDPLPQRPRASHVAPLEHWLLAVQSAVHLPALQ
jgi:hypothetical protein